MGQNNINIGNWVEFYHFSEKTVLIGYVISMNSVEANIYVPKKGRTYDVLNTLLICREEVELNEKDFGALIDFALDKRDFSWLSDLVLLT